MPRTSQDGNVIKADFRPRASLDIQVKPEILYCDDLVCLMRFYLILDGKIHSVEHVMAQTPTS